MNDYPKNTVMGRTPTAKPMTRPVVILQPGDVKENEALFANLSGKIAPAILRLRFGQRVKFKPVIREVKLNYEI